MSDWFAKLVTRLPIATRPAVTWLGNAVLGAVLAIVLHYVLYRIGLPSKPFIYVAF